jgi:hypothetical protein
LIPSPGVMSGQRLCSRFFPVFRRYLLFSRLFGSSIVRLPGKCWYGLPRLKFGRPGRFFSPGPRRSSVRVWGSSWTPFRRHWTVAARHPGGWGAGGAGHERGDARIWRRDSTRERQDRAKSGWKSMHWLTTFVVSRFLAEGLFRLTFGAVRWNLAVSHGCRVLKNRGGLEGDPLSYTCPPADYPAFWHLCIMLLSDDRPPLNRNYCCSGRSWGYGLLWGSFICAGPHLSLFTFSPRGMPFIYSKEEGIQQGLHPDHPGGQPHTS